VIARDSRELGIEDRRAFNGNRAQITDGEKMAIRPDRCRIGREKRPPKSHCPTRVSARPDHSCVRPTCKNVRLQNQASLWRARAGMTEPRDRTNRMAAFPASPRRPCFRPKDGPRIAACGVADPMLARICSPEHRRNSGRSGVVSLLGAQQTERRCRIDGKKLARAAVFAPRRPCWKLNSAKSHSGLSAITTSA
jgi:hypothetical protein